MAEGEPKGGGKAAEGGTTRPRKVKPKVKPKVDKQGETRVAYLCPWDSKSFPDAAAMQGHILGAPLQQGARGDGEAGRIPPPKILWR